MSYNLLVYNLYIIYKYAFSGAIRITFFQWYIIKSSEIPKILSVPVLNVIHHHAWSTWSGLPDVETYGFILQLNTVF